MTQTISLLTQISELGLENITTDRQKKNGTMMFFDNKTGSKYGIYKSGYIRRQNNERLYQLNQRPATIISRETINGHKYTFSTKDITLVHDFDQQLEILIKGVKNYRAYYSKNYQK